MEHESEQPSGRGVSEAVVRRDRLVREHMWLVKCVAGDIAENLPVSVDTQDLISAGTFGLIQAVENFDSSRGATLETYARYRIRGAILDELRRGDRLPQHVRAKLKRVEEAVETLGSKMDSYPTDDEIAAEAGIAVGEIPFLFSAAAAADLYSLEQVTEGGGKTTIAHLEETERRAPDPLSKLERKELEKILIRAVRALPRVEKIVLSLYYYEGLRMREIGEVLGISESRVSQIHSRAIFLLKGKVRTRVQI